MATGKVEIALLDKRPHNESVPESGKSKYQSWKSNRMVLTRGSQLLLSHIKDCCIWP